MALFDTIHHLQLPIETMALYVVPFLRYSMSKNIATLKSRWGYQTVSARRLEILVLHSYF